ncbi:helix-turn-helix domain-containing protein [Saccharopolyspora sp. ASAGF58]|uniref:helix-turn-helix domain-containing protein n=1 Tax=Saccharopolyspora sp. ASAGF58 TaxID=2719023 RepID=UPI001FF09FC8|nr:helix-turn-helix transcriptional regulator [Saccharopolyspora sp. ASAGF58]
MPATAPFRSQLSKMERTSRSCSVPRTASVGHELLAEPGAAEAYEAASIALEFGRSTREMMREARNWTQAQLAAAAGMTQPAVARFEAGGTVPTIAVLERLARALGAELVGRFAEPRSSD